jgi:hypothetical protein
MRSAVLVLLGGCAKIAGIDDTSGDGLIGVSLAVERVSIGATVVRSPQPLAANRATYLIADELEPSGFVRVPAVEAEPGLWVADIFDATPPVLFDLPEPVDPQFQRLWAIPNRDILGSFDVLEHPNPTPLADPTTSMLTVNATLDTAFVAETFELFVAGTWNSIGLPAPLAGATTLNPPAFPASSMVKLANRPHEQITVDDAVLVLRRNGAVLNGVLEVTPFDQTGNDTLTGTITTVPADRVLDIRFDPVGAANRLSACRPGVANLTFAWDLRAAPGRDLGVTAGPVLNSAGVMMADTMATAMYANPFEARGWGTVLTWAVSATRTTTPPGQALPVTLNASMVQLAADPTPEVMLDFPAGRVEAIAINGTSLSTDGMMVSAPTGPVVVTLTTDRTTDTLYTLDLFELVPNATSTALETRRVINAISRTPELTLPADVFEVGKIYTIRGTTLQGLYTGVADGDLRTRSLPIAAAGLDSGVFQVVP